MKFDEYTTSPLGRGRVQIMFTEPITHEWEISLFMQFFEKHKKKIMVTYKLKPNIAIDGLICHHKIWASFLKFIQRENVAIEYEKSIRSLDYDEMVEYLNDLKEAGMKEHNRQLSTHKREGM